MTPAQRQARKEARKARRRAIAEKVDERMIEWAAKVLVEITDEADQQRMKAIVVPVIAAALLPPLAAVGFAGPILARMAATGAAELLDEAMEQVQGWAVENDGDPSNDPQPVSPHAPGLASVQPPDLGV